MEKELTKKLQEIVYKCQAWIDDEKYIPQKYISKSSSEEYAEKIRTALEYKMIEQKFSFGNEKIYLPTRYVVEISQADSLEFAGIKRDILISELNKFVEKCFKLLAVEYNHTDFIQIAVSANLDNGSVNVNHIWEETYCPKISFNSSGNFDGLDFPVDDEEKTVVNPSFEKTGFANDDFDETETLFGKNLKRLFCLEIRRNGILKSNLPIFQSEISLGRGSQTKNVDILLSDDLEVSRHHAVLSYQKSNLFNFTVTGQNPVLYGSNAVYKGQTVTYTLGESFQIGSYQIITQV